MNYLKPTILAFMLCVLAVSLMSCGMSRLNSGTVKASEKVDIWYGQQGIVPDKVYQDFDWMIVAQDKYRCVAK